jgi:hypothetical protein
MTPVYVLLVGLFREMAGDQRVATHPGGAIRVSGYRVTIPGQQITTLIKAIL